MPDKDLLNKLFEEIEKLSLKIDELPKIFVLKEVFELIQKENDKRLSKLEDHQATKVDKYMSRLALLFSIGSTLYMLLHYVKW